MDINHRSSPIEILSPAGGPEALKAAVFSGAGAVYLAGPGFGARANARNFTPEELRDAAAFCRARGVKAHVTVNTLLKDSELEDALAWVKYLCSIPVDAVLVQDMGIFSLLRERAPELTIHASTQMSLHTPAGAGYIYELGASRAVLARELSLPEIEEISAECPIELESFVHGALCMSVSGQCYLSAVLGGRSGNRGLCAQPCRLAFSAPGGTGHDLSLKDLSFIRSIEKLSGAGVCSAKIEGRMKRPEYVAAATAACRKAADGEAAPEKLMSDLEAVFSRSGFTDGYLTGRRGRGMFGVRTKEDVAGATEKLFSSLRELYRGERQSVPVDLTLEERDGRVCLFAEDGGGNCASVSVPMPEETLPALDPGRCAAQLGKTGGTPFRAEDITVPEGGAGIQVSALNAMRREALDELLRMRAERPPIPFEDRPVEFPARNIEKKRGLPIRAAFRSISQIPPEAAECQYIMLPVDTPTEELKKLRGLPPVILELPRAVFGVEKELLRVMSEKRDAGFDRFMCYNLGHIPLCRKVGGEAHGGFGLNITNTAALEFFRGQGLISAEVSFELSAGELENLGGLLERGVMIYGRLPVMLTRNCPLANSEKGCLNCKSPGFLTDRLGKRFPVLCTGKGQGRYSEVFNSVPLWLGGRDIRADFGIARMTVENSVESGEALKAVFRHERPALDYTRGLFARGVE